MWSSNFLGIFVFLSLLLSCFGCTFIPCCYLWLFEHLELWHFAMVARQLVQPRVLVLKCVQISKYDLWLIYIIMVMPWQWREKFVECQPLNMFGPMLCYKAICNACHEQRNHKDHHEAWMGGGVPVTNKNKERGRRRGPVERGNDRGPPSSPPRTPRPRRSGVVCTDSTRGHADHEPLRCRYTWWPNHTFVVFFLV